MPSVISEHQQWFSATTGELIVNGSVYIGAAGLDPTVVANQLVIYSDRALTTAIANPQTTDANGQTTNKIWVSGAYSLDVTNSAGVTKYSELDNGNTSNGIVDNAASQRIAVNEFSTLLGDPAATNYNLSYSSAIGSVGISGGSSVVNGANIIMYGETHGTLPDRFQLRIDVNAFFTFEETTGVLELLSGAGPKTAALTVDATQNVTFSGDARVQTKTPASASAAGVTGTIAWDADYIYICTATDTWKRVAIATW